MKALAWVEELLQTSVKRVRLVEVGHNCRSWDACVYDQSTVKFKVPNALGEKLDAAGVDVDIRLLVS